VVGAGSGIDVAEVGIAEGVGVGVAVGVGLAEGAGVGVAVGAGVAVGIGVGVAVGVGLAEGVGTGVAVGVGLAEGVGTGVAVGVGLAEGVEVAGLQAKSNAPTENNSRPNSSLFILCEWVVMKHLACMQRLFKSLETTLHFFVLSRRKVGSEAFLRRKVGHTLRAPFQLIRLAREQSALRCWCDIRDRCSAHKVRIFLV
jgi:hypothetical protein